MSGRRGRGCGGKAEEGEVLAALRAPDETAPSAEMAGRAVPDTDPNPSPAAAAADADIELELDDDAELYPFASHYINWSANTFVL